MRNHGAQTSSVGSKGHQSSRSKTSNDDKNTGKMVNSFAVFAKIIFYITIFFKKNFKGVIQKMLIVGASDFRVKNNNFFDIIFCMRLKLF